MAELWKEETFRRLPPFARLVYLYFVFYPVGILEPSPLDDLNTTIGELSLALKRLMEWGVITGEQAVEWQGWCSG